ncbi:MAG TPA: phytanoyl-CoA dioxygenase family protein [Mycobacteriales bacterium]|nr:phytanoyl-CoA dioxygenase family protein [Mycobacteriales bacterium]
MTTAPRVPSDLDDGYFLVPDLVPPDRCAVLAERLSAYARAERALPPGVSRQREPELERSGRRRPDGSDIRKISGLYSDDLFRALIGSPEVADRMRQLMGPGLRLFRADALMKPAGVGSQKGAHQDSPYWPIAPMSLWSCWVPFDDATPENGCMMVVPGSQNGGARPHQVIQDDYVIPPQAYDEAALRTVPMRRGTGLFFHSLLIHQTAPNTSGNPRRAITMSYLAGQHRYVGSPPEPEYPAIGNDRNS